MGNVYPLDSGKKLILYESGNTLYALTAPEERLTRPVILCRDFFHSLSDALYNDTVYFCYVSTGHDVLVRNIADPQKFWSINRYETCQCLNPVLVSFQNILLVFYGVKNRENSFCSLKALSPFHPQRTLLLPEKNFIHYPDIRVICLEKSMLVYADDGVSALILSFDPALNCTVFKDAKADRESFLSMKQSLSDCKLRLDETVRKKEQLEDRLQKLTEEQSRTNSLLAEREALITNIERQYKELMDTALKYKEESAKWYGILQKQNTRPIPGEYLIRDNW